MSGKNSLWVEIKKVVLLVSMVLFAGSVWCYFTVTPATPPLALKENIQEIVNKTIDQKIPYIAEKVIEILEGKGYVLLTQEEYQSIKKNLYILNAKVSLLENKTATPQATINYKEISKLATIYGSVYYLCDLAKTSKESVTNIVLGKAMTCKVVNKHCFCSYVLSENKIQSFDYNLETGKLTYTFVERLG